MKESMITTTDNPFNPSSQFDEWFAFDVSQGYNTCAYVARIAITSNELSAKDESIAIEQAIDEIVKLNVIGVYAKVLVNEVS